jgi:hypothetical protein
MFFVFNKLFEEALTAQKTDQIPTRKSEELG